MAQAARKIVPFTAAPAPEAAPAEIQQPTFARMASDDDHAFESPALALQARVGAAVLTGAPSEAKWSYRKTFGFLVVVNGMFWATLAFLIIRAL
jgi:hypothetical protein